MEKTKVGVVGCGMISEAYFKAASRFRNIEFCACTDTIAERAQEKRKTYGCRVLGYEELLNDPEISIVLNLTPPLAHSGVMLDALKAGKHVYTEKPFGVDLSEANKVIALSEGSALRVGSAPDTFLGGGLQTSRKLVDDGWIGRVLSGTAIVQGRGPEKWGQAPFFYDRGAGPMLDLGPYYITALVNLLGPAKSVTAFTTRGETYRTFGAEVGETYKDRYRPFDRYPVNVDTHQTGAVEFVSGAVVTVIASFDVFHHGHAPIELYGTRGSLSLPDPNTFGGAVKFCEAGGNAWSEVPPMFGYRINSRSIGLADMAKGIAENRPHRACGTLARHVLEIMLAFVRSSQEGRRVMLESSCERPAPLPIGLADGELD